MQIVIDIPEEQIKKSLEESKHINEDEGEKGFVHIAMLYTNAQLEFVDVERKTDFYSCKYKILPKGYGNLVDRSKIYKAIPAEEDNCTGMGRHLKKWTHITRVLMLCIGWLKGQSQS